MHITIIAALTLTIVSSLVAAPFPPIPFYAVSSIMPSSVVAYLYEPGVMTTDKGGSFYVSNSRGISKYKLDGSLDWTKSDASWISACGALDGKVYYLAGRGTSELRSVTSSGVFETVFTSTMPANVEHLRVNQLGVIHVGTTEGSIWFLQRGITNQWIRFESDPVQPPNFEFAPDGRIIGYGGEGLTFLGKPNMPIRPGVTLSVGNPFICTRNGTVLGLQNNGVMGCKLESGTAFPVSEENTHADYSTLVYDPFSDRVLVASDVNPYPVIAYTEASMPTQILSSIAVSKVTVSWNAEQGKSYQLEYKIKPPAGDAWKEASPRLRALNSGKMSIEIPVIDGLNNATVFRVIQYD